ncbi:hypothetical protein RYX36_011469 [Vicia faba]
MALPATSYHLHGLTLATIFTVLFIFFFSISGGSVVLERNGNLEERKMVIGSRPPSCLNKCMNCRPCIATLVIPNNKKRNKGFQVLSRGDQDETYYLLTWKCICRNKLYQP